MSSFAAKKFIVQKLLAATPVTDLVSDRVYSEYAPEGAAFPHIIVSFNSGTDRNTIGARRRIMSRLVFLVKAVSQDESAEDANAIAQALETALKGASGTLVVSGVTYTVSGCYREQPVDATESSDGKQYNHVGGMYRILIQ